MNECTERKHNCDPNATCFNYVKKIEEELDEFAGYTCDCKEGFVGNGYICMEETDGIHSRMLVADDFSETCRASVLNRLSLFLVPDDDKPKQSRRMQKIHDRLIQLIRSICSDVTAKGSIRQCADSSYPGKDVLNEFKKLPTVYIWLDEVGKLLKGFKVTLKYCNNE